MVTGLLLALLPALAAPQGPPEAQEPERGERQRFAAPELDGRWLNAGRDLTVEQLRGRVVVLDFWTYCCINCLHMIPIIERLDEHFAEEPVHFIGVHANKFPQEGELENIRAAMERHGIHHPVVVDEDQTIWKSYGVRAWPTFVIIDPEGFVYGAQSGELPYELLEGTIQGLLDEHRGRRTLAEGRLDLLPAAPPVRPLAFPGKVLVHEGRLFVADSGNHRILELNPVDGSFLAVYGGPQSGLEDGTPQQARFRRPQGMAVHGEHLYVADTENHALRRISLTTGAVETVGGTGARGRPRDGAAFGAELASPWALETDGDRIHVAMAGSHQLFTYLPESGELALLAGNRRENLVDGPAADAQLAQPSGFALIGRKLWFADSETSAVRYVDLEEDVVNTMVGKGLFVFGDEDGERAAVRLQHPLGLAEHDGRLLVADTFNGKIKTLDPRTGAVATLFGTDEPVLSEEVLSFWEPGGIAVDGDLLYVADTNHHRVLAVDLKQQSWRVVLASPPPPEAAPEGAAEESPERAATGG